jgi:hypothetical protein
MATDGDDTGWEHVSVTVAYRVGNKWVERTPKWDEMSWLKEQFWSDEECVVQFHPPKKDYVNVHNHCLHLWAVTTAEFPLPPTIYV